MTVFSPLPWLVAAGLLCAGLAQAQVPPPLPAPQSPPAVAPGSAPPAVAQPAKAAPAPARAAPAARTEAAPAWTELTPQQQKSLAPLGTTWRTLSAAHKRKWIALSENYPNIPPAEQQLLHSRMAEWAALSPQQRTQARLNFAESKKVAPDDKKAKWEAYQALPPEEKQRLAAGANAAKPPPPPTAPAVQPVPQQKMATIPRPKKADSPAKIAVVPGQMDRNTLLPQPGPVPVQP
jgi:Protein of unknown function (DUF3106)